MIIFSLNIVNKVIVYYIRNLKKVYNRGKEIHFYAAHRHQNQKIL